MADKVENIMERMVDELQYYQKEELFSRREIKKLVKERRNNEYQMHRKDATLHFFLNSIKFEKDLDRMRLKRKKKQQKLKVTLQDHSIKQRVFYLYDRAVRKFKENIAIWKEYMEYILVQKAYNKLNRVVSQAVQLHPQVIDFWLIGVYTELDIKGNLFSSRKLMLQAIRNNDNNVKFYIEYFRFEVKFYEKIMERKEILNGGKEEKKIDFIDEDEEDKQDKVMKDLDYEIEGEISDKPNLVLIVFENIQQQFGKDFDAMKQIKDIVKASQYLDDNVKAILKNAYQEVKQNDDGIISYIKYKLNAEEIENLHQNAQKLVVLIKSKISQQKRKEALYMIYTILAQRLLSFSEDQKQTKQSLLQVMINELELNSQLVEQLLNENMKLFKNNYSQFKPLIDNLLTSTNRSLGSLILLAKSNKDIGKDLLTELEQKSWNTNEYQQKSISYAKYQIFKQMLKQEKFNIAEQYLKKCVLTLSGQSSLVCDLILQYSKLVKKFYQSKDGITFLLEIVRKASVKDIDEKTFNNLILACQVQGFDVKIQMQIYEEKLNCLKFKNSLQSWLEYLSFLVQSKQEIKAKQAYSQALLLVDKKSQEGLVQGFISIQNKKR